MKELFLTPECGFLFFVGHRHWLHSSSKIGIYFLSDRNVAVFDTMPRMFRTDRWVVSQRSLYPTDANGTTVSVEIQAAVERSFQWVLRKYPLVDSALIANWAEQVALGMQAKARTIVSPQRYAYAALKGKVRDWMRCSQANEEVSGLDLESKGGTNGSFQEATDRKILIEQLQAQLNDRDRVILILLRQDNTSPAAVAKALGTSYAAAAKAIQRMKERVASTLSGPRKGGTMAGTAQHNFVRGKGTP